MGTIHQIGTERAVLGGRLRRAREARGLTIAAVAAATKIPLRHLEALERGDALGVPEFYQRAEVRAVARTVGVDEELALAQLQAAIAPVAPPPEPPKEPVIRVRSQYAVAAIGAGLAVVVLLGWSVFAGTATSQEDAPPQQAAARATLQPAQLAGPRLAEPSQLLEPVPDTAAAPGAATELVVRTLPDGARVTVNGVAWGVSPVTIRNLEPGDKRIRVTKDGFAATERSVLVDEGSRHAVRIRLVEGGPTNVEGGL
jgi:transcriptional regulator with XRE-family HTH domain